MDESDTIVGIKGEVIHTYNKNEAAIKDTEYFSLVQTRSNVLLLGDNIGDAGMAQGMDHCHVVLKVGFLGRNARANLHNYLNTFDLVLVDEPTMDVPNAILKLVLWFKICFSSFWYKFDIILRFEIRIANEWYRGFSLIA